MPFIAINNKGLEVKNITKSYSKKKILDNVSDLFWSSFHSLFGFESFVIPAPTKMEYVFEVISIHLRFTNSVVLFKTLL